MNAQAAEALYEAERKGVRQAFGNPYGPDGERCAGRVILDAWKLGLRGILSNEQMECSLCGVPRPSEMRLVVHLNDDHGLTFSEIARKLGPDSA